MTSSQHDKQPLVSVIITCYNYGEYVSGAIESILVQTYSNIELIVINDGSSDNSLEVINQYKSNAKIINRENKGIVYTRNEGIAKSKGEYVVFLDADDFFDKNYIQDMVKIAEKTCADVVYPNWHVFGDQEYRTDFAEFDIQKLIKQELHCTAESLIRRSTTVGHKFESVAIAEDWDYFLGLALAGKKIVLAPDSYINYRVRTGTRATTKTLWENMYDFCAILEKWQQKYPKIVNHLDLPIGCGMQRDGQIEELKTKVLQAERIIEKNNQDAQHMRREIEQLDIDITNIYKSRKYRLGKAILSPITIWKKR